MIDKSECLQIGTITKTHGIGGEASILLNPGIYIDNVGSEFLFLDLDGGLVPFKVESLREKGDNVLLVKFEMLHDEKQVQEYKNSEVWMLQKDVTHTEESPGIGVLIGYKVIDSVKGDIGTITDLRDVERNPLFVIESPKGEILVPIADEFISEIDENMKIVYLNSPEGLLDLYM